MIDVHVHAVPPNLPGTGALAPLLKSPPADVAAALRREMRLAGVSHVLAMGAWNAGDDDPLGINLTLQIAEMVPGMRAIGIMDPTRTDPEHFRRVDAELAAGRVVALKGYLGYLHYEPAHPSYRPYYELAARHHLPVMFHTGDTYSPMAKLRFAHPLGVDDVAVDHPTVKFVLCHCGNPWFTDAAEVVYKNMNVWADLSGLLVGDEADFDGEEAADAQADLAHEVARAIRYSERPNRFLFGTDWPLAPLAAYRDFVRAAVPEEHHACVFEENARTLFKLGG
ncbi:MAG: amidohydrolase [Gemmataceae bacterium]|nr:amidohydrolase [Gemmataceae bacterium]